MIVCSLIKKRNEKYPNPKSKSLAALHSSHPAVAKHLLYASAPAPLIGLF